MLDTALTLPIALTLGLLSATHCLGMCGGIIGALSLSAPASLRRHRWRQAAFVLLYNLGRTLSYALAGALVGWLGDSLLAGLAGPQGHRLLQIASALMLLALGLYLAGWFPQLARIERLGVPLWRRIEPLGRRMLPVRHPGQAFVYGMLWGWLPCGMVYTLLAWSATVGGAVEGALTMAAFGLGTLPAMLAGGLAAQQLVRLARSPRTRRVAGVMVGLSAVATLALPSLLGPIAQPLHHVTTICP